jgi:hypothetical protein
LTIQNAINEFNEGIFLIFIIFKTCFFGDGVNVCFSQLGLLQVATIGQKANELSGI